MEVNFILRLKRYNSDNKIIKKNYYQEHRSNWDRYLIRQNICPISRTLNNKGMKCPQFLQCMCTRKEKGTYNGICK